MKIKVKSGDKNRIIVAACEPFHRSFLESVASFATLLYQPEAWRKISSVEATSKEANILLTRSLTPVSRALLNRLPNLKCVVIYGAGYEHIDVDVIDGRLINIVRCSREIASTIAEFTLGLALCLLRRIPEAIRQVENLEWNHNALIGSDLADKKVLVVGCGPIGCRVALLFQAVGAKVTVVRKSSKPLPAKLLEAGCRQGKLTKDLGTSDIVTLHVNGGNLNRNLIGPKEVGIMKVGAFLINTSRGTVIDFASAFSALCRGMLSGIALDVLSEEPPMFPLPLHPRLIYTPHLALYSSESVARRIKSIVDQIRFQCSPDKKKLPV